MDRVRAAGEAALAHAVADKVEAAYIRGDNMLDKRRRLMAEWASFCQGDVGMADNVTAIRSA